MAPGAKAPVRVMIQDTRSATRSQGARTTRRPHSDSQLYRVRERHKTSATACNIACNRRLNSYIAIALHLLNRSTY